MPTAPPRVCNRCKKPAPKNKPCQCRPAFEGSTHPGGHDDRRMAAAINAYRRSHLICQWPQCRRPMDHVDHVVPLAELRPNDPRRYAHSNMQSLCEPHHRIKTTADAQRGKTRAR